VDVPPICGFLETRVIEKFGGLPHRPGDSASRPASRPLPGKLRSCSVPVKRI
jgi:hypothetical protein